MIRTIAKKLHILTGMVLICITGIARSAPLPEYYGVYAVDGGKLIEIKDKPYEFNRNVQFIVFNKTINMLSGSIEIHKSVFVRNEIIVGVGGYNYGEPPKVSKSNKWKKSSAPPVETRIKPISGQPEQVYAVPREPLPPGFYSISFGGETAGYFFVDKKSVFQNFEAGPHCVDLEVSDAFASMMGAGGKEVPCNSKSATPGASSANKTTSKGAQGKSTGDVVSELSRLLSLPIASEDEYKKFREAENKREDQAVGPSNRNRVQDLRKQAADAARWGKWQSVVDLYNQILSFDSEDWGSLLMLSAAYNGLNQPDQTLEYAAKALKRFRYSALYAIVGVAYGQKGDKDKFLAWLEKAVDGGSPLSPKALDKSFPQYRDDPRYKAIMQKYQNRSSANDNSKEGSSQQTAVKSRQQEEHPDTGLITKVVPSGRRGEFVNGTLVMKKSDKELVLASSRSQATHTHPGVDIVAGCGSEIYAFADGKVHDAIKSKSDPGFKSLGYMVLLEHGLLISGKETYSIYLHMQAPPSVAVGERVMGGKTALGEIGQTGAALGCHTHFEIRHFASRLLMDKEWNYPWNIYGKGIQTELLTRYWENPETVRIQ